MTYIQIRVLGSIAEQALDATEHGGVLHVRLPAGVISVRSDGLLSGCCEDDDPLFYRAYDRAHAVGEAFRRDAYPHLYDERTEIVARFESLRDTLSSATEVRS